MKSDLFILIVCLLFPAYACADTSKHALEENRKLLHSLDSLLEQQDLFVRVKEERIKQLKMQYSRVKDVKELYAMNRMVYLEYRVYDADSALHSSTRTYNWHNRPTTVPGKWSLCLNNHLSSPPPGY